LGVLGLIGLVAPSNFGSLDGNTLRSGWPLIVLLVILVAAAFYAAVKRAHIAWLVARAREPMRRPLDESPAYEGAVGALAACPGAFRIRFGVAFVWGPLGLVVLGVTFAFVAAYFVIDAVLARFLVGWAQPLYALGGALMSIIVFGLAAVRLATWRLATSVYKTVSTGYVG
jgi:hypothetical protein